MHEVMLSAPVSPQAHRLWLLPLIAGLLPVAATAIAWSISVAHGHIPYCNPLIDGCVSVSHAARYGLGNHIFRALMLPAATLQGLTWLLCAAWLRNLGATGRSLKWISWLGVLAAVFLVIYGTFLGTEGDAYRWMRRYGTIVYFGFTYLCMLFAAGQIRTIAETGTARVPARLDLMLLVLLAFTLLIALVHYFVAPLLGSEELEDRIENVIEWFASLAITLFFLALGWLWRHTDLTSRLEVSRGTAQ